MTETAEGQLVGTLRYMSPEQLRGDEACAAWDLWALAVVAYEMLTGVYPFEAASMPDWHVAVRAGRFAPLTRTEWQPFFERSLAADPARRPTSARHFLVELESVFARTSDKPAGGIGGSNY
jgi:serine/threonine protein kinase